MSPPPLPFSSKKLPSRLVRCQICPDSYPRDEAESHLRGHDYLMFRCRQCALISDFGISPLFAAQEEALEHVRTVHAVLESHAPNIIEVPLDLRSIKCLECGLLMLSVGTQRFSVHLRQDHCDIFETVKHEADVWDRADLGCRLCGFKAKNAADWERHFGNAFASCLAAGSSDQKAGGSLGSSSSISDTSSSSSSCASDSSHSSSNRRRRPSTSLSPPPPPRKVSRTSSSSTSASSSSTSAARSSSCSGDPPFTALTAPPSTSKSSSSGTPDDPVLQSPASEPSKEQDLFSYHCKVCNTALNSGISFHRHMTSTLHWNRIRHKPKVLYSCPVCKENNLMVAPAEFCNHFKSSSHLTHLRLLAPGLFVPGQVRSTCTVETNGLSDNILGQHDDAVIRNSREVENAGSRRIEEGPREGEQMCSFCCKHVLATDLIKHQRAMHHKHLFKCTTCREGFYNASEKGIRKHLVEKHPGVFNPGVAVPVDFAYLICPFCRPYRRTTLSLRAKVLDHLEECHAGEKEAAAAAGETTSDWKDVDIPVQCRICNRAFDNEDAFGKHPCWVVFRRKKGTKLDHLQQVASLSLEDAKKGSHSEGSA